MWGRRIFVGIQVETAGRDSASSLAGPESIILDILVPPAIPLGGGLWVNKGTITPVEIQNKHLDPPTLLSIPTLSFCFLVGLGNSFLNTNMLGQALLFGALCLLGALLPPGLSSGAVVAERTHIAAGVVLDVIDQ